MVALLAFAGLLWRLRDAVLNPVNYAFGRPPLAGSLTSLAIPLGVVGLLGLLAWRATPRRAPAPPPGATADARWLWAAAATLVGIAAIFWVRDPAALGAWGCAGFTLAAVAAALLVERLTAAAAPSAGVSRRTAVWLLAVAMVCSTAWHFWMQREFWQHFMLGYADFGLYARELELCLRWDHPADRWRETLLANHAEPLFYALAPLYALFRSPLLLFLLGPLALNLAAVPFYGLAVRRSGSPTVGLLVALAWLALPSLSRMPYANTYGFQAVLLAVPLLAGSFAAAHLQRWRLSDVLLALGVLVQETVVGVAVGWALYVGCFQRRPWRGAAIAAAAIAWLALCALVIIPAATPSGAYARVELFGTITPATVAARLARGALWSFLLVLLAPLAIGLVRRPQALLIAAPTLALLALMQNSEYLSVKFWHQSSVLPALFLAAVLGVTPPPRRRSGEPDLPPAETIPAPPGRDQALAETDPPPSETDPPPSETAPPPAASAPPPAEPGAPRGGANRAAHPTPFPADRRARGRAAGVLVAVLLMHHALGFSPLAQAWRAHAANPEMARDNPRLELVRWIRAEWAAPRTRVAATERIAAHLIDFAELHTGRLLLDADLSDVDLLVLDRSDRWDPLVRSGQLEALIDRARAAGLAAREFGGVVVLHR